MSFVGANFAALFFVSCFAGITSTASGYAEQLPYDLADVAHMRHFELALRSTNLEWYREGMLLSAYRFNGYTWRKRLLRWAIVRPSDKLPSQNVLDALSNAFVQWSAATPFRFSPIDTDQDRVIDIRISVESFDSAQWLSEITLPQQRGELDNVGVTIHINDLIGWTNAPGTPGWYNLNFEILYRVTECLGLASTEVAGCVMNVDRPGREIDGDCNLSQHDIDGIRNLYRFNVPRHATNGFGNGHHANGFANGHHA